jgi:redox-sensing transcriptional repressor
MSFERQGFDMRAIFDSNPKFHHYTVRGVPVNDTEKIVEICQERKIDIGVICTPSHSAQEIADRLVEGHIRGIWNFAPTELVVPDHIILVHEHLTRGLLTLSYHIGHKQAMEQEGPILESGVERVK